MVLSLWAVVLLSLFAVALAQGVRQKMAVFHRLEDRQKLRALTEICIKKAVQTYRTVGERGIITPKDRFIFLNALSSGTVSSPDGDARYEISDENRRIHLSVAKPEVLKALFQNIANLDEEPAERLAYAIVDWRDPDDFVSQVYEGGSEKDAYRKEHLSYEPKNSNFETLSELLFVKGITREIYNSVENYITIYGSSYLNINTADKNTLVAAGLDPALADKVLAFRQGQDGKLGTGDDGFFARPEAIEEDLGAVYPLSSQEINNLRHTMYFQPMTTVSDCYRMVAHAVLRGSKSKSRTVCVFCQGAGIRYWNES